MTESETDAHSVLSQASLTINASFDIVRTYEEDVPTLKPLLTDYASTVRTIFAQRGDVDAAEKLFGSTASPSHLCAVVKALHGSKELARLTLAKSVYIMNHHRYHNLGVNVGGSPYFHMYDVFQGVAPFYKGGEALIDQEFDQSQHSYSQQLEIDRALLAELACSMSTYHFNYNRGLTCDHLTLQWLAMTSVKSLDVRTITLSQAFGSQLYLDIKQVLSKDIKRGHVEMEQYCEEMPKSADLWEKESPDDVFAGDIHLLHVKHNYKVLSEWLNDFVSHRSMFECSMQFARNSQPGYTWEDSFDYENCGLSLLQLNPILCGVYLFQSVNLFRGLGAVVSSIWKSIVSAGQLYYACQLHRDLRKGAKILSTKRSMTDGSGFPSNWTDSTLHWNTMEYLFEIFGREYFFDGFLPASNYDMKMHHCYTDEAFTEEEHKKRQERAPYVPLKEPPKPGEEPVSHFETGHDFLDYKHIAISHRLFYAKYRPDMDSKVKVNWTQENLKVLLETQQAMNGQGDPIAIKDVGSDERAKKSGIKVKQSKNTIASQVALLHALQTSLSREHELLCFDFLSFHVYCLDVLRKLRIRGLEGIKQVRRTDLSYRTSHLHPLLLIHSGSAHQT
jgi:hypothetical protein